MVRVHILKNIKKIARVFIVQTQTALNSAKETNQKYNTFLCRGAAACQRASCYVHTVSPGSVTDAPAAQAHASPPIFG